MSFKRLEDDTSWLQKLQQRRVAELLSNDVPKDEALLMKNGKFACLVCTSRPIFDTVAMLTVHRNGKKHTTNLEQFEAEKRELYALKQKRRHEEYVKQGKVTEIAEKKSVSLMDSLGPAYDPRVKRPKKAHTTDKLSQSVDCCLSISPEGLGTGMSLGTRDTAQTARSHQQNWNTQSAQSATGNKQHHVKSKFSSKGSNNSPQTILDYKKSVSEADRLVRLKLKPYVSKRPQRCRDEVCIVEPGSYTQRNWPVSNTQFDSLRNQPELRTKDRQCKDRQCGSTDITGSSLDCSNGAANSRLSLKCVDGGDSSEHRTSQISTGKPPGTIKTKRVLTEVERLAGEKYLKATESGWKRDRGGKWIKDEAVEFESDEEPPDIP